MKPMTNKVGKINTSFDTSDPRYQRVMEIAAELSKHNEELKVISARAVVLREEMTAILKQASPDLDIYLYMSVPGACLRSIYACVGIPTRMYDSKTPAFGGSIGIDTLLPRDGKPTMGQVKIATILGLMPAFSLTQLSADPDPTNKMKDLAKLAIHQLGKKGK